MKEAYFCDFIPKPLDATETEKLLALVKVNQDARNKIISHNIRLVIYRINTRFEMVDYDKSDLISIGIIGLIKAVDTYNGKKGKFPTYASKCIDNELLLFLRNLKKDNQCYSLSNEVYPGIQLEDVLIDDYNIEEDYEQKELYEYVRNIVLNLPDREQKIIKLYFGFYGRKYKQVEIANILNISQSYVAKNIKRVLSDIGYELKKQKLFYKKIK